MDFHAPGPDPTDVHIRTADGEFFLHSRVLKMFSKWFAASMSTVWWKDSKPHLSSTSPTYQYQYMLDIDKDNFSTLLPVHLEVKEQQAEQDTECQEAKNQEAEDNLPEIASNSTKENFYNRYKLLFSSLYRLPIEIKDQKTLSDLISIADQYQALDPVADSIRASLFEWESLDIEIKKEPVRFLEIGYKLKSARIFKEAFIHCVGLQYAQGIITQLEIDAPTNRITRLILTECYRLEQLIARAMRSFLSLGSHGEYPHRVKTLVRSELGRCFDKYPDSGEEGKLFRNIVYSSFQPISNDLTDVEKELLGTLQHQAKGLVNKVKDVARPLIVNNLSLKEEMDYLTCAELQSEDLPWL